VRLCRVSCHDGVYAALRPHPGGPYDRAESPILLASSASWRRSLSADGPWSAASPTQPWPDVVPVPTLIRMEMVYAPLFACSRKPLWQFPALWDGAALPWSFPGGGGHCFPGGPGGATVLRCPVPPRPPCSPRESLPAGPRIWPHWCLDLQGAAGPSDPKTSASSQEGQIGPRPQAPADPVVLKGVYGLTKPSTDTDRREGALGYRLACGCRRWPVPPALACGVPRRKCRARAPVLVYGALVLLWPGRCAGFNLMCVPCIAPCNCSWFCWSPGRTGPKHCGWDRPRCCHRLAADSRWILARWTGSSAAIAGVAFKEFSAFLRAEAVGSDAAACRGACWAGSPACSNTTPGLHLCWSVQAGLVAGIALACCQLFRCPCRPPMWRQECLCLPLENQPYKRSKRVSVDQPGGSRQDSHQNSLFDETSAAMWGEK